MTKRNTSKACLKSQIMILGSSQHRNIPFINVYFFICKAFISPIHDAQVCVNFKVALNGQLGNHKENMCLGPTSVLHIIHGSMTIKLSGVNLKGQMHHHDDLGSKCAYMCHLSNKTTRKSVLLSTPQIWLMKVSKKLA